MLAATDDIRDKALNLLLCLLRMLERQNLPSALSVPLGRPLSAMARRSSLWPVSVITAGCYFAQNRFNPTVSTREWFPSGFETISTGIASIARNNGRI